MSIVFLTAGREEIQNILRTTPLKINRKGDKNMKRLLGYSPPFSSFLIETLNTGRILTIEKNNMDGADKERADSG